MSALLIEIRRVQDEIPVLLDGEKGCTFGRLFDLLGLVETGRVNGTSHMRVLDRALQGLRKHGDIRFNKKRGVWETVPKEVP